MKTKIISLTILVVSFLNLCAQNDSSIVFQDIEYSEFLELAKSSKKPMMLYFYFDGCPPCAKMKNDVFTNPEVASFYNNSFLNFKINTKKGNGIEINKHFKIQLHPTFLYLNKEGEIVHKAVGLINPEDFISNAKMSLEGGKTYSYMKNKYLENPKDPNVIYEYVYYLNEKYESNSEAVLEYLKLQTIEDLRSEKNLQFLYDFCYHNFYFIVKYGSREFNFMADNKELFTKNFDLEQLDARLILIAYDTLSIALKNKDSSSIFNILSFLEKTIQKPNYKITNQDGDDVNFIMTKSIVSNAKFEYYTSVGNQKMILEILDTLMTKNWENDIDLNNIAWKIYQAETLNKEIIAKAVMCAKRATSLNGNYYNFDTYAAILFKSGNIKKAKKQAKKAIKLAKKSKIDYIETQKLLDKINNA